MITLKEIAALADVSIGTVDRVVNHRNGVSEKTRAKIQKILDENEYETCSSGRALSIRNKEFTIAYVYASSEGNPFFADIICGMNDALSAFSDYNIKLLVEHVSVDKASDFSDKICELTASHNINGFILTPFPRHSFVNLINQLSKQYIPVMTCNVDTQGSERLAYIGNHYYSCGILAAGCMAKLCPNSSNIAIISGYDDIDINSNFPYNRVLGFETTVNNSYPRLHIIQKCTCYDDDYECYHQTKNLLKYHPDINGIFLSTIAINGFKRAIQDTIDIPDIKIVAIDEYPSIKEAILDGTIDVTICQKPYWQGYQSIRHLLKYIINKDIPAEHIYSDMEIKIKENYLI